MNLQIIKSIGEQILALAVELLKIVDTDENERQRIIDEAKKMPTEKLSVFRWQKRRRKLKTILSRLKGHYISPKRS